MSEKIQVLGPTYIDHTIRLKDEISLDGSARIEDEELYPGGTGLCYAIALSRLENPVVLHSILGTDEIAAEIQRMVNREANLEANWQQTEGKTDYAYILIDRGNHKTVASRKLLTNRYQPEKLVTKLGDAKAVVLTSFRNDILVKLLESLKDKKRKKTFVMWAPHLPNCENAKTLLPNITAIDHITLSLDEFKALEEQIGNPTDHGVKSVTVTNGKNGCDLITKGGIRHFNAIQVVENPLDTNGAGEAFGSGFLTVFLETGDYETAVRAGSYLGFLHVHRRGSDFPKVPRQELLRAAQAAHSEAILQTAELVSQTL